MVLLLLVRNDVDWLRRLDQQVAQALHGWVLRHRGVVDVLRVVQAALHPDVFRIAVLLVAARLWREHRPTARWAVGTTAVGLVLDVVLKLLVHRPRPSWPDPVATSAGYSFPSGHALGSLLGAGVLLVLLRPVLTPAARPAAYVLAGALVLLTGVDRLALGVHYLSDVLAGWLVAAAVLASARWATAASGRARRTSVPGPAGREP